MTERKLNLLSGALAVVAALALVGWFAVRPALEPAPEPGRRFVAYFDDAAGIETGDAVRIEGRRAGFVTDVTLAEHEGKLKVRIEFEIRPGSSSKWLNTEGIPADSRISVSQPGMFGRPQLVIAFGKSDELVPEGGEWTRTRGASSDDELTVAKAGLEGFNRTLDQIHAFFDGDTMSQVRAAVEDLLSNLRQTDQGLRDGFANAPAAANEMQELIERLDRLATDLKQADESLREAAERSDEMGKEAIEVLDNLDAQLADVLAQVRRAEEQTEETNEQYKSAQLHKQGLELRKFSAQLRRQMERAEGDPSQAGDTPNWRLSRKFFNGAHPLPGGDPDNEQR